MKPPEILKLEWKKGDGPTPYVYSKKAPGHRCAWSCRWLVKPEKDDPQTPGAKTITVDMWVDSTPESMTDAELMAELEDGAINGPMPFCREAARLIVDRGYTDRGRWHIEAREVIQSLRESYKEFVDPFNAPDKRAYHAPPPSRRSW